ncbi:VOC family protein [Streptomyces sp. SD11]|uniref:VOC family protein n=1 Tax=Streptomyces sp. SD11 TaxID=3452209 RepID=UPI003F88F529
MAGSDSAAFAEGVPCWIDAQLPDVEAGKRFYGGLFGWTFEPYAPTEDGRPPSEGTPPSSAGGRLPPEGGQLPPAEGPGRPAGDGRLSPDGGQRLPAERQERPADDGQGAPAGGLRPPPDGRQAPAGGQKPPPEGQQAPEGGHQPPAGGLRPPPEGRQAAPEGRQAAPDGQQSPAGGPEGRQEPGGRGAGEQAWSSGYAEPASAEARRWADGPYAGAVRAWLGGEPVAALVPKRDGRMPTVWAVYFATPDAHDMADRIRKGGGQIVTTPVPVGPYGVGALAADPEGAVFGLWQAGTHPGFGRSRGTGTFSWVELYSRDTATADAFYPGLFREALFGPGATREFGRAHISDVYPAEMPPHFVVHFGVQDCEAAVGAVVRLGGRVQAPPFDTSYGRVAVVSDNQGASFALLQRRDGG